MVYCSRFESDHPLKGIVGSNPTPSANGDLAQLDSLTEMASAEQPTSNRQVNGSSPLVLTTFSM